jgi:hypothetical protein
MKIAFIFADVTGGQAFWGLFKGPTIHACRACHTQGGKLRRALRLPAHIVSLQPGSRADLGERPQPTRPEHFCGEGVAVHHACQHLTMIAVTTPRTIAAPII